MSEYLVSIVEHADDIFTLAWRLGLGHLVIVLSLRRKGCVCIKVVDSFFPFSLNGSPVDLCCVR